MQLFPKPVMFFISKAHGHGNRRRDVERLKSLALSWSINNQQTCDDYYEYGIELPVTSVFRTSDKLTVKSSADDIDDKSTI